MSDDNSELWLIVYRCRVCNHLFFAYAFESGSIDEAEFMIGRINAGLEPHYPLTKTHQCTNKFVGIGDLVGTTPKHNATRWGDTIEFP